MSLWHGFGGRTDLPVPRWLFVYGAATAVLLSFAALGALWKEPRLERASRRRAYLPEVLQRVLSSVVLEQVVRGVSFLVFLLVIASGALGQEPGSSFAAVFVFIWFWIGLAFLHALFGNLWATLSPWDSLARLLAFEDDRRPYPERLGYWPAAALLFAFVWLELVFPVAESARSVAVAVALYSVVTLVGMEVFGRETWNRRGEAFAVYFRLVAAIAPVARDEEGRVYLRPPLAGLSELRPEPGLIAFVIVLLGSTTFDGFSRSQLWNRSVAGLSDPARMAVATVMMLGIMCAMGLLYRLAMAGAARIGRDRTGTLPERFVHSLVPIAFAYVVAHYFSLLVLEGQLGLIYASDPLGAGWNLFGTALWRTNLGLVSANTIWYVQVAAIVSGHVGGVILAHDRSIELFPPRRAVRTQVVLLVVMVVFTVVGLSILSGG